MLRNMQFFIFSPERVGMSNDELVRAYDKCVEALEAYAVPFMEVGGRYEGVTENSFLVDAKYESLVIKLALEFGQESVLFVDSKSNATLYFLDGKVERLGKFTVVDRETALTASGYTYFPESDKYFIVKGV